MKPLLIPLPGNEEVTSRLGARLHSEVRSLTSRRFPDGETYLRFDCDVRSRSVVLVCTLDRPDDKILRLIFAAETARDLGATRVGLIAPYLAYMRQDRQFQPGEAVTSKTFAELLSKWFDWLCTVDPHLHRRTSMSEIYSIPASVVHAAPAISAWIKTHIASPVLIGPDVESRQWVAEVANVIGAPFATLEKTRRGDRDVEIGVRQLDQWRDRTPILIDDIISSGHTMEAAARMLVTQGFANPIVVGVHGIFADDAFERLERGGAAQIVTTNSVPHRSSVIDITDLVKHGVSCYLE